MAKKTGRKELKVPFLILPLQILERLQFYGAYQLAGKIQALFPTVKSSFDKIETKFAPREYISLCIISSFLNFLLLIILAVLIVLLAGLSAIYLIFFILVSSAISLFIFLQQILYPRLLAARKINEIEKKLIPVLQNMLVQLNSGIPLFNIFVDISLSNYGEISREFEKVVKEINAGIDQIVVLEELAARNPSPYFRRAVWQMANGMKMGSDVAIVVKEIINTLSEQQLIQIQRYGSQLNPLSMFYMLVAVIFPSLGITFLIIISSFIGTSGFLTKLIFFALYFFTTFAQLMFLGLIKARRPSLLE